MLDHADLLAAQRLVVHGGTRGRLLGTLALVAEIARQPPDLPLETALALSVEHEPQRFRDAAQRHGPQPALQIAELVTVPSLERREGAISRIDEELLDPAAGQLVGRQARHAAERRIRGRDPIPRHAHESMVESLEERLRFVR